MIFYKARVLITNRRFTSMPQCTACRNVVRPECRHTKWGLWEVIPLGPDHCPGWYCIIGYHSTAQINLQQNNWPLYNTWGWVVCFTISDSHSLNGLITEEIDNCCECFTRHVYVVTLHVQVQLQEKHYFGAVIEFIHGTKSWRNFVFWAVLYIICIWSFKVGGTVIAAKY